MSDKATSDSIRSYLDVTVPHFHVARGAHPGGHFLQRNAWEVRETVMQSLVRCILRQVDKETEQ